MSLSDFWQWVQMGEHGLYVWSAYGLAGAVLALNALVPRYRHRRWLQHQRAQSALKSGDGYEPGA